MFVALRQIAIDFVELVQCKVALAFFRNAHFAFDHVASVQIEAAHLAGGDVNIVGTGGVIGFWVAQKAKAIGQHFKYAIGKHGFAIAGAHLDDGKHEFLFAQAARIFDFERFGLIDKG